jgi:hypothetical protein
MLRWNEFEVPEMFLTHSLLLFAWDWLWWTNWLIQFTRAQNPEGHLPLLFAHISVLLPLTSPLHFIIFLFPEWMFGKHTARGDRDANKELVEHLVAHMASYTWRGIHHETFFSLKFKDSRVTLDAPVTWKEEPRFDAGGKQERPIYQGTGYQELLFVYSLVVSIKK